MRNAIIEAETREEVMQEMEERIRNMEKIFARRLMKEVRLDSSSLSLCLQFDSKSKKNYSDCSLVLTPSALLRSNSTR